MVVELRQRDTEATGRLPNGFGEIFHRRLGLSDDDLGSVRDYLNWRAAESKPGGKNPFGIVFVVTKKCNLLCLHCAPNATYARNPLQESFELTLAQVRIILDKVRDFTRGEGIDDLYLIYGGGEPTLHPSIGEIIQYSADLFGPKSIAINTNGTTGKPNVSLVPKILGMIENLGDIEVSIDGPREYHNRWRNPRNVAPIDAYQETFDFVRELVSDPKIADRLEVSSILTRENSTIIFELMRSLEEIGVRRYSIHRPMPVGRMTSQLGAIPNSAEYLQFLVKLARFHREHPKFNVHIHHSLESIYSALLLGQDIHLSKAYMSSNKHSIGIDWGGNVHFDPWAMEPPFSSFVAGNLLEPSVTLRQLLYTDANFVQSMNNAVASGQRCLRCPIKCSGGMRFNAVAHQLRQSKPQIQYSRSEFEHAITAVDPACPMYLLILEGTLDGIQPA